MTNVKLNNPIFVDTADVAGVEGVVINKTQILGIGIRASADNWVVTLKNEEGGTVIFDQESKITNDRGGYFPVRVDVTGIYVETLTNITNVLVYRKASV